jgi:hypothetical protein
MIGGRGINVNRQLLADTQMFFMLLLMIFPQEQQKVIANCAVA